MRSPLRPTFSTSSRSTTFTTGPPRPRARGPAPRLRPPRAPRHRSRLRRARLHPHLRRPGRQPPDRGAAPAGDPGHDRPGRGRPGRLRPSLVTPPLRPVSQRRSVAVAPGRGGLGTLAPTPAAAASTAAAVAAPSEVPAAPAVVLRDLGGGEAQAGPDLVGDDLDDVATVAVTVLVAALLEATGDDDAGALRERLAHVLGHHTPARDVDEA